MDENEKRAVEGLFEDIQRMGNGEMPKTVRLSEEGTEEFITTTMERLECDRETAHRVLLLIGIHFCSLTAVAHIADVGIPEAMGFLNEGAALIGQHFVLAVFQSMFEGS